MSIPPNPVAWEKNKKDECYWRVTIQSVPAQGEERHTQMHENYRSSELVCKHGAQVPTNQKKPRGDCRTDSSTWRRNYNYPLLMRKLRHWEICNLFLMVRVIQGLKSSHAGCGGGGWLTVLISISWQSLRSYTRASYDRCEQVQMLTASSRANAAAMCWAIKRGPLTIAHRKPNMGLLSQCENFTICPHWCLPSHVK